VGVANGAMFQVFHIVTNLKSDASDQAQELQGLDRPDGHVQQHQVQQTSGEIIAEINREMYPESTHINTSSHWQRNKYQSTC
jgi:hypothetical protein